MKAVYLLVLISLVTCLTTIEKIKCFTENDNLLEHISKVIEAFKAKDFHKVLSTLLSGYFSVQNEIKDCLNGNEPNLEMTYCAFLCMKERNKKECIEICEKNGGEIPVDPMPQDPELY